jgi:hypothetical protein
MSVGGNRPDKLALLFDEEYTVFIGSLSSLPTEAQLRALQLLDSELNTMSGPDNASLWTESAFVAHPQWERIRSFAQQTLREFEW